MNTYNEIEESTLTVTDNDTMDLETARQLLHDMVEREYSMP